jgi:hypothetical protein
MENERERDRLLARTRRLEDDLRHAAEQLADAEARLTQLVGFEEFADNLRRERDRALSDKAEAHEIIQSMQQTRLWRIGSAFWRVRDTLLRRG